MVNGWVPKISSSADSLEIHSSDSVSFFLLWEEQGDERKMQECHSKGGPLWGGGGKLGQREKVPFSAVHSFLPSRFLWLLSLLSPVVVQLYLLNEFLFCLWSESVSTIHTIHSIFCVYIQRYSMPFLLLL